MRAVLGLLAVGVIMPLISSCSSSSSAVDTESPPPVSSEYLIGPGDNLQVFVWQNEDISQDVIVRPDGKITTPLVEDMPVAGKTPTQLARDMEVVLSEFIRAPKVSIIVSGFQGVYSEQVRVVGKAANPRSLSYRNGMTLLDVMIEVGGLAEFAAGNRAKIVRRENGRDQVLKVRIDDLLEDGDISENVAMAPGDILIIPESRF
jgi:polysaccharide export outer membrane protein